MIDLSTRWLGLKLKHPIVPGASPLVDDLDTVKQLEDAGASAITMHSLFEEQLVAEQLAAHRFLDGSADAFAEAPSWLPSTGDFKLGPDAYLEQVSRIRRAVDLPVIGSLNGTTPGGWLKYAKLIEQAGAHALELNLYDLPGDPGVPGADVEHQQLDVIRQVQESIRIPVAVKLSPFYSSLPAFVAKLEHVGVAGIVLFNRLYQPDIDIETLSLKRVLHLSDRSELLLRLRWLAILSPHTRMTLACSGGVHDPVDVVKALMAGAQVTQVVSALLETGPQMIALLLDGLRRFLEEHEYTSVAQLSGSMNLARCPDPSGYERTNYVKLLQSWHGGA
ncbi:MAG: dihydroorotate dehydrogenase-like protein [Myxococcaceae bacterium]|jgi:dihydroorotate dehydrogenase (fumarate)|nr:dihydroorotate dehydrogenase-like protein [Myxococcaceae bacterium]